jgi:cytochrome b involved in lipid metabolism
MRRGIVAVLVGLLMFASPALAHQPVTLLNSDTSAAVGPLLVDGTISFAVRADFKKAGEKKGFTANLKAGDRFSLQYLIVDKKPENTLKVNQLPSVVVTTPSGSRITLKINERIKFYEPFGKTNYLYLSRYSSVAQEGTYNFLITSRAKSAITLAVGDREVSGEVTRGTVAAPIASPAPTPTPTQSLQPSPKPTATTTALTMEEVKKRNSASECWTVIDGKVYNLTKWIPAHRGGPQAILFLCGKDGSSAFKAQHEGSSTPESVLGTYLLGALTP